MIVTADDGSSGNLETGVPIAMRGNRFFAACIVSVAAIAVYSAESDTSYGDYRVKDKERRRGENGGSCRHHVSSEDDDTASCLSGCFDGCFQTGFDVLGEMIQGIVSGASSGSASAREKPRFDQFAEPQFRYALGAGLGMLAFPEISTGFQAKVFNHFYLLPSHPFNFRANTGLDFSVNSIHADFERDVFVGTVWIGTQTIVPDVYTDISIPLLAELVFRPSGKDGSFHFIAGGGAGYFYERVEGVRTASYDQQRIDTVCSWHLVCPLLSLGIGWFTASERKFGSIELYYKICFNRFGRKEPLPGDNTAHAHSMTVEFSVVF